MTSYEFLRRDRSKPRRLDEAKHVGRHRHAHVVTAAQKLPTDGGAGLDIAASSIACQRKFHRRNLTRGDAYTSKRANWPCRYRSAHALRLTLPLVVIGIKPRVPETRSARLDCVTLAVSPMKRWGVVNGVLTRGDPAHLRGIDAIGFHRRGGICLPASRDRLRVIG